jgi:integrase
MHYLRKQEVEKILTIALAANKDHHQALLLAWATGARVSQILGGRYNEREVAETVKGENGKKTKTIYKKTGSQREMPGLTGTDVYVAESKINIHELKGGVSRFHNIHKSDNPVWDMSPLLEMAAKRGGNKLFGSLTRQYLSIALKKYGKEAGVHPDLCHMHAFRHGIAMCIWDATQRLGAITTFLQHSSPQSALQYLAENDGKLADEAVEQYAF